MNARGRPSRAEIREMIRKAPAVALIAGAILGSPPGLDPPPVIRSDEDENSGC
ncbi:hypothetical protein ACFLTM_00275 [Candidatus Bipolaricaulota bacterium]